AHPGRDVDIVAGPHRIAIEFDRDDGTDDSAEGDVVAADECVAGDLGGAGGNVDLAAGQDGDGVQRLSRTRCRGRTELGRSVTVEFGAVTGSARLLRVSGLSGETTVELVAFGKIVDERHEPIDVFRTDRLVLPFGRLL